MMGGAFLGPTHQNVMWTFLIALLGMKLMDKIKEKGKLWFTILVSFLGVLISFVLGFALFVDYYGTGIMMVYTFYFFHQRKWWCYLGQFLIMYWLNVELLGGLCYIVNIFGHEVEIVEQGLALISL